MQVVLRDVEGTPHTVDVARISLTEIYKARKDSDDEWSRSDRVMIRMGDNPGLTIKCESFEHAQMIMATIASASIELEAIIKKRLDSFES